jgi:hypothetical protein
VQNDSLQGIHVNRNDPWVQIVGDLHCRAASEVDPMPKPNYHRLLNCASMWSAMANASSIRRIEWQTTCTILISWSDSTLGRYVDQIWRAGFARTDGVCGLTGKPVRRGDAVFRPLQRGGDAPKNAFDMILAETVPNAKEITPERA